MHCTNPHCSDARMDCVESRYGPRDDDGAEHRRRRYRCPACGWRYATVETIVNVRRTPG